jgi:ribosomal protein S18 acetylase RimI-like enzyme
MVEKVTLPQRIGYRAAFEKDVDFLYSLHVATMKQYVDQVWGWEDVYQESLFRKNYVPANIQIIEYDDKDIGMLSVEERAGDVFLSTIEIRPEYQSKGIGTAIIKKIVADSAKKTKPVTLQVLKVNPAKGLYERLGFEVVEETKTHYRMSSTISK